MKRKIDHIVYCVPDLEEAVINLEKQLGVKAAVGGKHNSKGTKNALINLGDSCYLEILAIDTSNNYVKAPRWMGVDLINKPTVTRICLKSEDLEVDQEIIRKYNPSMGEIETGKRQTPEDQILSWQMILPLAKPEVEVMPFMVDWSESKIHPTDHLSPSCTLNEVIFYHPKPEIIASYFKRLNYNGKVLKAKDVKIEVRLKGVFGEVIL